MNRKAAVALIVGLLAFLAFAAWFDVTGRGDAGPVPPAETPAPSAKPDEPTPSASAAGDAPDEAAVEANRDERRGPAWSPADLRGKDGKPITMGNVVPGAFGPVRVGSDVQDAVDRGLVEQDRQRGEACEGGPFWKWKGQWVEGLDVIVGPDKKIAALGMSRGGLETAEGISIGNSYAALKDTYGERLEGPQRTEYGQAGLFLREGARWVGFLFDNEAGGLSDDSRIVFIEVTNGERPGLLRDGC